MFQPPMPGAVLAEYLGGMDQTAAAAKIGIGREHLMNLIIGTANIDAHLASKLARSFGTSPDLWLGLQAAFDAQYAGVSRQPNVCMLSPVLI